MSNKNYSEDTLKEYVSSELEIIKKEKENPDNWKKNSEYFSQVSVRIEEG